MEDNEILEVLNSFKRNYRSYYYDTDLAKQLALNLNRTEEIERNTIIDFFLREISSNKNGMWSLCLDVLVEASQGKIAPELEKIYYSYSETKDEKWQEDMIMAMLRLKYAKPHNLYNSFINYHLKKKTGRAFFLMVQYCRVDFLRGSELLSDYYAINLLSKDSYEYNNQHHIGYLIYWLMNSPNDCLPEIIKQTNAKNKVAGNYLKQAVLSFLNSGQSGDLKHEQVKESIRTINEVVT